MNPFIPAPRETVWRMPACVGAVESGQRRVLVADDSIDEAQSMASALSCSNFDVKFVHTGMDAIATCQQWMPGAVVLDLSMPLGDGWEAVAAIKACLRGVYVVAHSSFTSLSEVERSQRAGFDAYFIKPCDKARLVQLLTARFQIQ